MSELTTELKKQLSETSETYKGDIEDAFRQVIDRMGKTGINILVISGSLLVSYLLYRAISGSGSKQKKTIALENGEEPVGKVESMMDRMADKVMEQTMVFLLQFAKERLMAFLSEAKTEEDDNDPGSTVQ